jgi:hypothetical protein
LKNFQIEDKLTLNQEKLIGKIFKYDILRFKSENCPFFEFLNINLVKINENFKSKISFDLVKSIRQDKIKILKKEIFINFD